MLKYAITINPTNLLKVYFNCIKIVNNYWNWNYKFTINKYKMGLYEI